MKRTKRSFTSAFKAEVAIEAIKERESLSELARRFKIHANMISKWKQEFLEKSSGVFDQKGHNKETEEEKMRLYAKIGQLELERDWLKKISKQAGL